MMRGLIASSLADARFGLLILVLASLLAGCEDIVYPDSVTGMVRLLPQGSAVQSDWQSLIHFDTDKAELRNDDRNVVARIATLLAASPGKRVVIEGYADERGTREYNLALGARRANAYKTALVAAGVAPERIADTISYGKERPVAAGSTEAAWAQNRRAVVVPQ